MTQSADDGWRSSSLLRAIGYCLLVLALFDVLNTLLPPSPTNPAWQFQTVGALVERVPVTFLGLGLVFYAETDFRSSWERLPLKILSWVSLLAGITFVLLAPLLLYNSLLLDNQINYQINTQVTQQLTQIEQLENLVAKTNSPQQLGAIVARLNPQGAPPNTTNTQQLKSQLLAEIKKAKDSVRLKSEAAWEGRRQAKLKNSIKWFLGSLISGTLFIYIWLNTRWARRGNKWSR